MYTQLQLAFLLFVSQIVLNRSDETTEACNRVTITLEIPKPTPIVAIRLDYNIFSEDHAAYKIHEELATWTEAVKRCESEYAHLAIPETVDKLVHINSLKPSRDHLLHVGMHLSNITNQWVRVDNGLPVTSIPWAAFQPNPTDDCAGISISENALVSYPCDRSGEQFVCEVLT